MELLVMHGKMISARPHGALVQRKKYPYYEHLPYLYTYSIIIVMKEVVVTE